MSCSNANATPPRLGQYFAGRSASCGRVVLLHYVEPNIEMIPLTADHKSTLSLSGVTGLYENGDFFVGIPMQQIVAAHVSLQVGAFYLQGGVADTCDEAISKLAQMCVISDIAVPDTM